MRQVRHIFADNREANAFVCGVNWVNDGSIEVIDVLVGWDEDGNRTSTVLVNDEDGDEDVTFDHRECV